MMHQSRSLAAPFLFALCHTTCLAVAPLAGMPVWAQGSAPGDDSATDAMLCLRAAESAARQTGVPLPLLLALTLTETGRRSGGAMQPWPWALNQGGDSHWLPTRAEALDQLSDAISAGVSNIDIGCFQLNYRWHGSAFSSLEQMLDPEANALYAARLVASHAADLGDWVAAAGAYHSATPDKAAAYLDRFKPIYAALGDGLQPALSGGSPSPRQNTYPLLIAGGKGRGEAASGGSIVPRVAGRRALIGGS